MLLTIVFSNHCNIDCSYCCITNKGSSPVLSIKDATNFVDKYSEQDNIIEFYGGEPTLHLDELKAIIAYCKLVHPDKKYYFRLYTNGLFDHATCVLFGLLLDEILISLDGHDLESNKARGLNETQLTTIKGNIYTLAKMGAHIGVGTVLFSQAKYSNFRDDYEYFKGLGVRYFSYEPVTVWNDDKPVIIGESKMFSLLSTTLAIMGDYFIGKETDLELCIAKDLISSKWYSDGEKTMCSKVVRAISPRGNVYMCRDHAANEDGMFKPTEVIKFHNKNNLIEVDGGFKFIEQFENVNTPCSVKNMQFIKAGAIDKLWWLDDDFQTYVIKPIYMFITYMLSGELSLEMVERYKLYNRTFRTVYDHIIACCRTNGLQIPA